MKDTQRIKKDITTTVEQWERKHTVEDLRLGKEITKILNHGNIIIFDENDFAMYEIHWAYVLVAMSNHFKQ